MNLSVLIFTALPSIGNFYFAYWSYSLAPEPTRVAMLLTSQVVVTVLLSYFVLHERDNLMKKVFAAVLVVHSAILIKS